MIRRPPRSTLDRSSAASDVYKRQALAFQNNTLQLKVDDSTEVLRYNKATVKVLSHEKAENLSLIHISEPTRPY